MPILTGVGLVKKPRAAVMPLPDTMVTGLLPSWESPQYSRLLKATKLFKPYTSDKLLGLVKKVLNATLIPRAETAPPAGWQSRPQANRFQL